MSQRVTVLWFPDWPVYAIGRSKGWDVLEPAAIIVEHKILACNVAARRAGVKRGMKQRHALAACPQLLVSGDDSAQQAMVHEDVLTALSHVAAGIETLRPGLLVLPMTPLAKYYGSEDIAVELLLNAAVRMGADCLAGTADDVVTAVWAARAGYNVEPGGGARFVAELPIEVLASESALGAPYELVELLRQLGVHTVKQFAALPRANVAARCGAEGVRWHRVARGEVEREVAPHRGIPAIEVRHDMEEPIMQTETAAFIARQVAAQLHSKLCAAGDACLRLSVRAYLSPPSGYEGPTVIERVWRCREPLTESETAQRVRWQLDGWITRLRTNDAQRGYDEAAGQVGADWCGADVGIAAIELVPVETIPAGRVECTLWGGADEGIRAARAAAGRAQALIGVEKVLQPVHRGGRAVVGRVMTVPYGEQDPMCVTRLPTTHWEGELLHPLPALMGTRGIATEREKKGKEWKEGERITEERSTVAQLGINAEKTAQNPSFIHPAARLLVVDESDEPVYVTGRGMLNKCPAYVLWGNKRLCITGWAGPWPVDEEWWSQGKRYARLQVSTDEPSAYLLVCRGSIWRIEATY
ncbi:Y-family DNA polymerase [Corynebacterium anserum]|uniref:DNA polymerase Y family protein n=1 Tax=Corynebacterium anserum TaxID=2684406 RepID=A0A7G7YPV7_9CORY|nr:DNA polymerase Y family protein [Corynebacterium anserum]MBC2682176.1 DNA polymerase Y family protein [Corynebacterium anserum]QNH96527.1 DNA polymerase Y family protein [Corynebacterium anserum]